MLQSRVFNFTHCLATVLCLAVVINLKAAHDPFKSNYYSCHWPKFDDKTIFCGTVMQENQRWAFLRYSNKTIRVVKIGDKLMSYLIVKQINENFLIIKNEISGTSITLQKYK